MSKAIVVGSINMDIVFRVRNHPKVGETIYGQDVKYYAGGKGLNQAVACCRLGCKTLMLGCVGDDAFGDRLLSFQENEGVDITGVRRLKNIATGTAFITVAENSENSIIVVSGANAEWGEDVLDDLVIEEGDIILAQFEISDDAIYSAFKRGKERGALTILNPAPIRAVDPTIRKCTDLLVVNEHEMAELSGSEVNVEDDASLECAAERLGKDGYCTVIATLGSKGAFLWDAGKMHRVSARPVIAVDTTGAGDTFIGGLAAGLLSGMDLIQAAAFGNLAASISVTRPGAAPSIPTLEEINQNEEF